MDRAVTAEERGAASGTRGLLVAVPFYKNEELVGPLLASLLACRQELATDGAEVVFYNDSPAYAPLDVALREAAAAASAHFPCRLQTNPQNLGFVRTMNLAISEAIARGMDFLALNSDAEPEPGAIAEMRRVAGLDHMIGFVNPRSNNATIATLPWRGRAETRAERLDSYRRLAALLPPVRYVPTSVGFCMLVAWRVLAEFGGFDEVYGQGYNEENDMVMRASRCGYRAVLANHAFVWHVGERSFSKAEVDRSVWEPVNRAILDQRYPEYAAHTDGYYHSPEAIAERLLAALIPDSEGKRDLAFDFSSFRAAHNGTFQAGHQILQAAGAAWGPDWRIHVMCEPEVYDFHRYAELGIPRADPHDGRAFAAVFRVGQPYDWGVMQRLVVSGAAIGLYMLDTISIDCPQLSSPLLYNMWQSALDHADLIAAQSHQTHAQLSERFAIPGSAIRLVSHHSLDLADYLLPGSSSAGAADGTILVLGNHFHHKYLPQTANALAGAFPDRTIVALGPDRAAPRSGPIAPPAFEPHPNLRVAPVGALTDEEMGAHYAAASVIIFPSHAEGFGFPALNALAARRPIFVRRLPVFEELWDSQGRTPNIHFYDSTAELIEALRHPPCWTDHVWDNSGNGALRSAREIARALERAVSQASHDRIVRRIRLVQLVGGLTHPGSPPPGTGSDAAKAARFLAENVETIAHRALAWTPVYFATRLAFRSTRAAARLVRRR